MNRINLIAMAGRGSRFFQKKYNLPKPFVPVRGMPMFLTAVSAFPPADHTIFIVQDEHLAKYPIGRTIQASHPDSHTLVATNGVTEGQAATCLLAEEALDPQASLFIAACDCEMVYDKARYAALASDPTVDVIIWTFKIGAIKKANPNAFAYCRVENGRVTEVVEKLTISDDPYNDPAVVGSFTYRSSDLFIQGAKQMIAKNIRVNNEFYVGTSINQLIEAGYRVVTFELDKFISFGNPFELRTFEYWEEYFDQLPDHPYAAQGHGNHGLPPRMVR